MTTLFSKGDSVFKATQLVPAFVEGVRLLNTAENTRNAANPALTPKQNVSMTASFDGNVYSISATLPVDTALTTTGQYALTARNYLGTYGDFVPGTSELESTNLAGAVLELAQKVQAAELQQPEADRPNNIQLVHEADTGTMVISASIPFNPAIGTSGEVTLFANAYI